MLRKGDDAPDLEIETHLGDRVQLSSLWADGPLVLFFYPKDDTMICTKQACTMQDAIAEFGQFDAKVLGASTGTRESHAKFAEKNNLNFPLVCDNGDLAKAYKSYRSLFRIPKRITYVIRDGKIEGAVQNELNVNAHLEMVRGALS